MLVAQDAPRVEIYRRTSGPHWQFESYSSADELIELPCPPSQITLADIYERIEFAADA